MSADVESARRDWLDGYRRLQDESRDSVRAERLQQQVDVVTQELRRRVGSTFTLAQLAAAYGASEHWLLEAVAGRAPAPGWPRTLSLVGDAAFHLYARNAVDYRP